MGDGFTLWVVCPISIEAIKNSNLLSFSFKGEKKTGLMYPNTEYAEADNLRFEIKKYKHTGEYIRVTGNFYVFHKQQCNDGDFSFEDLANAIRKLVLKYDINPFTTMVKCFEIGVNIPHKEPDVLLEWLICMQGISPTIKTFNGSGNYRRIDRTSYWLKFYNKTLHCKGEEDKIRIEIRGQNSRFLKKSNIVFLTDLLEIKNLLSLNDKLMEFIEHIIMFDYSIDLSNAKPEEREILLRFKDAKEWKNLLRHQNENHRKKRIRFKELVKKYSNRDLNNEIIEMVKSKASQLLTTNNDIKDAIDYDISNWKKDFTALQV